jgi:hypothetical protein
MAEGGGDRSFEDRHRQYACFENWVVATFRPSLQNIQIGRCGRTAARGVPRCPDALRDVDPVD